MGLFDSVFGKKKPHNNAFNNPLLAKRPVRELESTSIFFREEFEPSWMVVAKPAPQPIPLAHFISPKPPEIPLAIRQKVGHVLEGRFQMSPDSHRLISLLNDTSTDPSVITQAITKDPNFTTRILRTVNSAQFGLATQITAIGRAVVLLGFNNIRTMALAHAVKIHTGGTKDSHRMRMLWMNSAISSACSASMAKKMGQGIDMGEAATAGLLMNIGKMLLKVEETGMLSAQTGLPPCIVEGFAGSCFAQTWGLPDLTGKVLEAASTAFHYPPESIIAQHRKLALTVAFSGFVARWYGFANGDIPELPSQTMLDAIGWKVAKNGHWIENDTALEIEKARMAMQVYLG